MRSARYALLLVAAGLLLAGCESLLPKAQIEVRSAWGSFAQARDAIEAIEPGRTTTSELRARGIDPYANPNIQLLTFSDIALRFPINMAHDRLDPGLRQCIEAGKACTGYSINVREVKRDRIGGFWQDTLGFKRTTQVTGWTFNALLLLVGDRVVYTLYGGQPQMDEMEVTRQPLGPVQDFGESLPIGNLIR